nr:hypothetical protein [Tanacetum cinerariifolium]
MEAGSKDRPPMLAPGNYIQWKSRIKRYIDTKPNRELIHYFDACPNACEMWKAIKRLRQDSQMHNNIMAAGSRDRPPMLAPGRYPQWRLQFLRYVDTRPNGEALRKCILSSPYKLITVLVQAVKATDNSPAVLEHTTVETSTNMSPKNKAHFLAEKEIHLILTGIGDDIYSTVDACQTAQEIWEAIERFMTIVKQQHKLDEVSYHKLFDILKQYQNEVNELHAEKLARNANPLALVATAQASQDPYYQSSRSYRSSAPSPKLSIPSRSHTTTRHKGKEIAKPINPPSETASEEDSDPECNISKLARSRILGSGRATSWINNTRYILNDQKFI